MNYLIKVFNEILYLGAISSILIVLILVIKKLFGKVLSPKWHYYIWILLLIRLLIPYTPESSLSALNLFYIAAEQLSLPMNDANAPALNNSNYIDSADSELPNNINNAITGNSGITGNTSTNTAVISNQSNQSGQVPFGMILSYGWLLGMLLLTIYTVFINLVFAINVKKNYKPLKNVRINNILEECKRIEGIKRTISLFTTKKTRTPSLYALFHIKILVSEAHLEQLSDHEIKCIFLHELSHFKRKDIAVNWVISLLQIVYFFNPLIWFAFYKVHEDCEISCDAEALKYLREEEYQSYGSAVIKLIKLFSESNFIPATAGLWKHKSNYKRRIIMISKFRKRKWPNTLLTIILILAIGLIGLTGCKKDAKDTSNTAATDISTTTEDTQASEEITVTAAPTPEITKAPINSETTDQVNLTQLAELLGLSKTDLISKLGDTYEKVDEGGLEFVKQGIRVWFDEKSITNQVYSDKSDIDFNGAKIGDSINSFKNVFGDPISDENGNAIFNYNNYYLSVYYDTKTEETYAIYLLTEDVAAPAQGNAISSSESALDETALAAASTSSSESFFGNWVISQVMAYGSVGTYSKEDAESLIGKSMSFTSDSASCFGDQASYLEITAKNPKYETSQVTGDDFEVNYRMTLEKLGITTDSVTEVIASDTEGNGSTFLIKDDNTLIVIGGGTYFELVRK